tara:strand:- start:6523 stop:6684 length:162 start_codon:yes stop_codon:yes gene_type:complete
MFSLIFILFFIHVFKIFPKTKESKSYSLEELSPVANKFNRIKNEELLIVDNNF